MAAIRKELNNYVETLHTKYRFGYSLFDLFTNYSTLGGIPDVVYFPNGAIASLTEQNLSAWTEMATELASVAGTISNPADHPLKAITLAAYSPQLKFDARALIERTAALLTDFDTSILQVSAILKLQIPLVKQEQLETVAEIAANLLQLSDSPATFLTIESPEQTLARVIGIAQHGKKT